jgi:hypothetical protein
MATYKIIYDARRWVRTDSPDTSQAYLAPDGSAAAPSYSFENSPTTGLFRSGADVIGFSIAGTQAGWWNATGLGLGQSPAVRLVVGKGGTSTNREDIRIDAGSGAGGHAILNFLRNTIQKATIGVPGSAGTIVAGDAANDLSIASAQQINISADGGTTRHILISTLGAVTVTAAAATETAQTWGGTTTAAHYMRMTNTTADMVLGIDSSVGGRIVLGSEAYSAGLIVIANKSLYLGTNNLRRFQIDGPGNIVLGTAALATTATDGFLNLDSCAGVPTGVPTAFAGRVPVVDDTTSDKLWAYNGGWKQAGLDMAQVKTTLTLNELIDTTDSSVLVGPLTINSGVVLTIASGGAMAIL